VFDITLDTSVFRNEDKAKQKTSKEQVANKAYGTQKCGIIQKQKGLGSQPICSHWPHHKTGVNEETGKECLGFPLEKGKHTVKYMYME
jgi:hypothetical protein